MIEDMHNRMTLIMKDLSDAQKTAQLAIDEGTRKQEKMRLLEKQNTDLKQELKHAESTLNQIHARALDSSSAALSKYEEVTRKYEATAQSLEDKERELAALHKKNTKLLELNEKFDENWAAKFREAIAHKDTVINNLTVELSNSLAQAKEKSTQVMYTEKQEMMNTLWKLKQEAADKDNEFREILREQIAEISVKKKEISDLQEMLRMSVQKEKSAKDLIMELTELLKQVQGQIDTERETHSQEISIFKKKDVKLENDFSTIENKYKITKSRLEDCDKELNSGENLIYEKTKQINKLKREIENATEQLEETFNTVKTYKTKLHKSEEYFNNEICSLKSTVQDLELSIGTKNVIINDQNENISELKHTTKQYEDEIRNIEGYKSQYRENYEDKLQVAYDDIEKLRRKLKASEETIRKLEEQLEEYEEDKQGYKQTITKYETQLQEKLELIEAIEKEVKALQEEHEQKLENIIDEKDKMISDLKLFRDELNASLVAKGNECKYQTQIAGELETQLNSTKQQLNGSQEKSREMQDEIRVLLLEINNQKRQASETIAQLTKIFS